MFSSSLGTALLGAVLATNVVAHPPAYAPERYSDRIDIDAGAGASLSARHFGKQGTPICSHDIGCSKQGEVLLDT